jgi:hypothetical protein
LAPHPAVNSIPGSLLSSLPSFSSHHLSYNPIFLSALIQQAQISYPVSFLLTTKLRLPWATTYLQYLDDKFVLSQGRCAMTSASLEQDPSAGGQ